MKGSTQAALALGFGYVLGRRRKFRRAVIVAGAMATGGAGALGSTAMRRGAKVLGSSDAIGKVAPQLGGIGDAVRGQLLNAGKTAAIAVVSNRIEALSDSLHQRAEAVRDPGANVATVGDALRGRRRGRQVGDDGAEDDGEYDEGSEYEDEAEYEDRDAANDRNIGTEPEAEEYIGSDAGDEYDAEDEYEAGDELDDDEDLDDERLPDASADSAGVTARRGDEFEDDDAAGDEPESGQRAQRLRRPAARRSPDQRRRRAESPVSRARG